MNKNIIYLTLIASIILWLAILLLYSVGIVSGLIIVLCFGMALFILFKILYYRSHVRQKEKDKNITLIRPPYVKHKDCP